jgi:threonyl-tRNA synthetase
MLGVIEFFTALYATVGMSPDEVHFSTKPDKAVGAPEQWELAENAIARALEKAGIDYLVAEGEGSFYGPKIDIHVRDAIGRLWQMCTIQVDFQEPDRFGLEYTDEHGERVRPVMIHRALYGAIERFMGVLVEHFAGAFPPWLAPVQAVAIPIADRHAAYAEGVKSLLLERGIRAEADVSDNTLGAKIRHHQLQKVPYMLIVGDNEASSGTVSVRSRSGKETRDVPIAKFADDLDEEIGARALVPNL